VAHVALDDAQIDAGPLCQDRCRMEQEWKSGGEIREST
jgi:hypothetical protein